METLENVGYAFVVRACDSGTSSSTSAGRTAMNIEFSTKTTDGLRKKHVVQMEIVDFVKFVQNIREVLEKSRSS